jgi:hypothetical protein
MKKNTSLAYILSLPRSGSTVLSALLDRRKGIVSPPESCFPQMLGMITDYERKDPRWLAALYLGCTFPPTPLTLEDAEKCMKGSNQDMLIALGKAVAVKLDRDPDEINVVVWKTPRMIGMHKGPLSTDGKFIILRRNPHNVYESQFRVEFGKNNRNPYRFALFRESYEHSMNRIPKERIMNVSYDDLPSILPDILGFFGVQDNGEWDNRRSSLDLAAENCTWMTDVTKEFLNRDKEKRARLDPVQVKKLDFALRLARPTRCILGPMRSHFDKISLRWSVEKATNIYKTR